MNRPQINELLAAHDKWLLGGAGRGRPDFSGVKLTYADLAGVKLTYADLAGADLAYTNLTHADITHADITRVNLAGANLAYANLTGANLTHVNLTGADLTHVNLTHANLTHVNLTGANLRGAKLTYANLAQSRGIVYAQCAFNEMGSCGRQMLVVLINGEKIYFCGCETGDGDYMREYIESGDTVLIESRMMAFEFVTQAIEYKRKGESK